jgi:prevent-host-death family protein
MTETITAADAEHQFARLLREVADGKEFVVTVDGAPVARLKPEVVPEILPDGTRKLTPAQEAALARTMERLSVGWPLSIEKFDRNKMYEEIEDERISSLRKP